MESKRYKTVIIKQAEQDISQTLAYITEELKSPMAAQNLFTEIVSMIDAISMFPYSMPKLKNDKISLGNEYRTAFVNNFVLIYKIVEELKEVRIMAVLYASSDIISRVIERL